MTFAHRADGWRRAPGTRECWLTAGPWSRLTASDVRTSSTPIAVTDGEPEVLTML